MKRTSGTETTEQRRRPRGASRPGRKDAATSVDHLLELQRQAGNNATARYVQRLQGGAAGGGSDPSSVAARIRAASGAGIPLPADVRGRLEGGLGADLGAVRVHTGGEADRLNRSVGANAFTTGRDIFFRSGSYRPGSPAGMQVLAHEAVHVLQQSRGPVAGNEVGGGIALSHPSDAFERSAEATAHRLVAGESVPSFAGTEAVAPAGVEMPVQRHSSWEHMLIGDLTPDELGTLGSAYDIVDDPNATVTIAPGKDVVKRDVVHVLEQEIRRLGYFQQAPPQGGATAVSAEQDKLAAKDQQDRFDAAPNYMQKTKALTDPKWDVRLVSILCNTGATFMVTYGEMNTLADFFGSVDEMKGMQPAYLDRIIRGVRQSTMQKLVKIYKDVTGKKQKAAKKDLGITSTTFGHVGGSTKRKNKALPMGGVVNELKIMGSVPSLSGKKKPKVGGAKESDYSSTLARNACHFAPESWHAWADHHEKALNLADRAYDAEQAGDANEAAELQNEALLTNGFGDHYLQDSYASGHLINKTLVMVWYTKYLDKHRATMDFHKDKNWRKVQDLAYSQQGIADEGQYSKTDVSPTRTVRGVQVGSARNPQAAQNIKQGGWQVKAEALGLKVPSSVKRGTDTYTVLTAWQQSTLGKLRKHAPRTARGVYDLVRGQLSADKYKQALAELICDGVARMSGYSARQRRRDVATVKASLKPGTDVVLREAWIPKKTNQAAFQAATAPGASAQNYSDMALGALYNEYLEFMNSGFLQKATNTLHNVFCKDGLMVAAKGGDPLFKVYGDDNMFQREAGKGLVHSGTTAKQSLEAIMTATGSGRAAVAGNRSTQAILNRLPAWVQGPGSGPMSLKDWHTSGALQRYCDTVVFPGMDWGIAEKFAPGALGKNLGKVDDRPDKTEVF